MRGFMLLLIAAFTLPVLAQPTPQTQWSQACGTLSVDMAEGLISMPGDRVLAVGWGPLAESGDRLPCALLVGAAGDSLAMTFFVNYPGGLFGDADPLPGGGCRLLGVTPQPGHSDKDALVVELDASGAEVRGSYYGGIGDDIPTAGVATVDGGYLMVGMLASASTNGDDLMLMKLDDTGAYAWQRFYGGAAAEWAEAVVATPEGGAVVAGVTTSFGAGEFDAYLLKVNLQGDTLWTRTFGGAGRDVFSALTLLADGSVLCTGDTDSAGVSRIWLVKVDANGGLLWQRHLGEAPAEAAAAMAVIPAAQGGFALAGTVSSSESSHGYLVRVDGDGEVLWRCRFVENTEGEWFTSLVQTADGGFVMAGTTVETVETPDGTNTSNNFWVVKTGPDPMLDVPVAGAALPTELLLSAYPNPFNATTTVALDLPQSGPVTVTLVDALGRQAQTFDFPSLTAGRHELRVDGTHLATGVYFARVKAGNFHTMQKLVLLK